MYMSAAVRARESYRLASQCLGKDRQFQFRSGAGTPGGTSRAGLGTIGLHGLGDPNIDILHYPPPVFLYSIGQP